MEEDHKTLIMITLIGAIIGVAQVLTGEEPITLKLFFGRMILGSATSMSAGAALVLVPDLPPIAIIGIASALGIAGYQALELWVKSQVNKSIKRNAKNENEDNPRDTE